MPFIMPAWASMRSFSQNQNGSPTHRYSSVDGLGDELKDSDGLLSAELRLESHEPRPTTFWRRNARVLMIHTAIVVSYTLVFLVAATRNGRVICSTRPSGHSPATSAVVWEERTFVLGDRIQEKSKYSGKPSPAVDLAWHDLLNDENIRIEAEIVEALGRQDISVRVPGESSYIGTLNVYHELHCLKRLHQYMYQDHYYPDFNEHELEMNRLHSEHCIDFLRQSSMCHGDIGLITFEWSPTNRIPVANATTHQCVDWNKLDRWTKDRSVDMMQPGWLVHPQLGLAYPDGMGSTTGAATGATPGHNHKLK